MEAARRPRVTRRHGLPAAAAAVLGAAAAAAVVHGWARSGLLGFAASEAGARWPAAVVCHEAVRPAAGGASAGPLAGLGRPLLAEAAHRSSGSRLALQAGGRAVQLAVGGGALAVLLTVWGLFSLKAWLDAPSRPYAADPGSNSVRAEYDQWTREGVLEHYWGEHIHMGSYTPLAEQHGYDKDDGVVLSFLRATYGNIFGRYKDFVDAKLDFSKEMLSWSGTTSPKRILDVGCGIGGTSRFLARTFPEAEVVGITLSPEQAARATELAHQAGLRNVSFRVMNALDMTFEGNLFDLVWACESGEHMPDKQKYVREMSRVLAPGGNLVIATWCERDPTPPFSAEERRALKYVYEEWSHPFFISISKYAQLMGETGVLDPVETDDWTERTLPSWRHSVWVGVWSPWYWLKTTLKRPKAFLGFLRDAYCLEQFHRAMRSGLLTYGMMKARKKLE